MIYLEGWLPWIFCCESAQLSFLRYFSACVDVCLCFIYKNNAKFARSIAFTIRCRPILVYCERRETKEIWRFSCMEYTSFPEEFASLPESHAFFHLNFRESRRKMASVHHHHHKGRALSARSRTNHIPPECPVLRRLQCVTQSAKAT